MSALYHLTARELRAQSPAMAAALFTALLPWVAPLLPLMSQSGSSAADVRATTAAVLATLLGLALAAFCGAGLLARDVADGRIGFFLSLPLRAGVVWGGRLLAATLLVYGSMALVALPALLAGRATLAGVDEWPREALVPLLLLPLLVLLVAHHLAVALRSRSPWMLVDLAVLAGAAVVAARAVSRLQRAVAPREMVLAAAGADLLVALALVVAGGAALRHGGLLMSRVHRVQMVVTGAGVALAAVATAAYATWVLHPTLAAVEVPDLFLAAPQGTWVAELARMRHRPSFLPWLLVDPSSGRSLALPSYSDENHLWLPVTFGADGRSFLALRPQLARFGDHVVVWVDLTGTGAPRAADTGVVLAHPGQSALLAQGDRLAAAEPTQLAAWSGRGATLLGAAALPRQRMIAWQVLRFVGDDQLRLARIVYGADGRTLLQRYALSLRDRHLRRVADVAVGADTVAIAMSAEGDRVVVTSGLQGRGGVSLYGFDAAAPTVLLPGDAAVTASSTFLPGGRLAVAMASRESLALRLYAADGRLLGEHPLGSGHQVLLGPPWAPTRVPFTAFVAAPAGSGRRWQGELREVDVDSGAVRVLGGRLRPLFMGEWSATDDAALTPPGAPATHLFVDAQGQLVRVGPDGAPRAAVPGQS